MLSRGSRAAFLCAFFSLGVLSAVPAATAQNPRAQNTGGDTSAAALHPVLVELFTSEGCSSCPPADALLTRLDADQPIAGAQLIVLSEHVTYWDHEGWKDPNSSAALTDRQVSYERVLHHDSPATPQMIVDGSEVRLTGGQEIQDALTKASFAPKVPMRISNVTVDPANPGILHAHIETDVNSENKNADVYVAAALDHFESQVLKGENGGKHLVSVAVVNSLTKVGKLPKGSSFSKDVEIKLTPGADPKNIRLVAFAQESGPGMLLGAVLHMP